MNYAQVVKDSGRAFFAHSNKLVTLLPLGPT